MKRPAWILACAGGLFGLGFAPNDGIDHGRGDMPCSGSSRGWAARSLVLALIFLKSSFIDRKS